VGFEFGEDMASGESKEGDGCRCGWLDLVFRDHGKDVFFT
jgi:hypothetical protein